jgi:hypothetical protein
MILIPKGFCPEGNIINEGNVLLYFRFPPFKAIFHCSRFARAGGAGFENLLTRA